MLKKILLSTGTIAVTIATTFAAISCGTTKAPVATNAKGATGAPAVTNAKGATAPTTQVKGTQSVTRAPKQIYTTAPGSSNGYGADIILDKGSYNKLYDEMKTHPGTVALAVVANNKVYTDIVNVSRGETVLEALDSSKFIFKRYMHEQMGAFINSFAIRDKPNVFMHGTNTNKNYGDFYPMYYINHKFAQLGVSNFHLAGSEVLEISYDKQ